MIPTLCGCCLHLLLDTRASQPWPLHHDSLRQTSARTMYASENGWNAFIDMCVCLLQVLGFAALFALTAPIAILIGTALDDVPALVNLILTALSTGTFLYIGAYEVISEEFRKGKSEERTLLRGAARVVTSRYLKFLAIVLGLAVISGVAFIPHADHGHGDGHGHGHGH